MSTYNPPPSKRYDMTQLPAPFDQNAEHDLMAEMHERLCYLSDLVEQVLGVDYLTLKPRKK